MISLDNYIIRESNDPVSDDAILYKIAKYKFNSQRHLRTANTGGTNTFQRIIDKYDIDKDNPRPGLIRWARAVTPKLLPDKEEIIHRKDWHLSQLNGETELQLMHPDYVIILNYILKHHKRKHDILTIFECSNSKPYAASKVLSGHYTTKYGVFTDFACMSNPGVIPMEYSQFYPYRFDEWDHGAECDDIAHKYCVVNEYRFLNYVKALGYKHVIILMQNPHTQICFDKALKEDADGCSKWLHIVSDKRFRTELDKRYLKTFNNNEGLVITRMMEMDYTHRQYEKHLRQLVDNKEDFDELVKLIIDKDSDGIKQWNREHGWKPYEYEKGIEGAVAPKTKSGTVPSGFKTWLDDKLESVAIKEKPEKLRESGIYFTVLDYMLEFFGDKAIDDPDTTYWAIKEVLDKNDKIKGFSDYCYYIKEPVEKFNISLKDIQKEADKLKIIQLKLKQQKATFNN